MAGCHLPCSGNYNLYCGGFDAIYVFETKYNADTYQIYNTNSSNYVGCYKDGGSRVLSGPYYQGFAHNNINMCIMFCSLNGYYYAGLEYGLVKKVLLNRN